MVDDDFTTVVTGMIHEDTQVGEYGIDLTVAEIFTIESPGRVDFGGGELEAARVTPHERVWRNEDDAYQWWELTGETYLIEYNEQLHTTDPVVIQTRDAVRVRGAYHPTVTVTELGRVPLTVAPGGIRLKENARLSTVRPKP